MRSLTLFSACLVAAVMSGCLDQVAAPEEREAAPLEFQGKAGGVPFILTMEWTVTPLFAPGFPLGVSTFDGICSQPSTWYLEYTIDGTATHMGRISGDGSHCGYVEWGPSGEILGGDATDGELRLVAADGSELRTEGLEMTDAGPLDNGGAWWTQRWHVISGTGRFEGATGGGMLYGAFLGFDVPAPISMVGTLDY